MVLAYWQQHKTESSEINANIYGKLIFDKGAKAIQGGKKSFFNKQCWTTKPDNHMEKNEAGSLPHFVYKNQLKVDLQPKYKS